MAVLELARHSSKGTVGAGDRWAVPGLTFGDAQCHSHRQSQPGALGSGGEESSELRLNCAPLLNRITPKNDRF